MEDVRVIYKDIHSPDSGSKVRYNAHHDTTECEEYCHGREIKLLSSPSMIRLDHTQEPTLVKGGEMMTTGTFSPPEMMTSESSRIIQVMVVRLMCGKNKYKLYMESL